MGVGEQSDRQLRRLERARFLREAAERVNDKRLGKRVPWLDLAITQFSRGRL
jgi:hypothetical protein